MDGLFTLTWDHLNMLGSVLLFLNSTTLATLDRCIHRPPLTLVASCSNRCSCSAWSKWSFLSLQLCSRWLRAACIRSSRDETLGATLWKSAPPDSQLPWLPPPPLSLEASPCEGPRRIRWSKLRPSLSRPSTGAVAMVLRRRPCSSRSLDTENKSFTEQ